MAKLDEHEVQTRIKNLNGWVVVEADGSEQAMAIERNFQFKNFSQAFAFMTQCALQAEVLDHHPDWFNSYNRVNVRLTTHSAGGLTERDFQLAGFMNSVADQ